MIVLMRTFANDGTRNSISKSDFTAGILTDAFIEGKINEADESKRWYITPKINAVTDLRAEPITFDVDGIPQIIDQGVRTFAGSYYAGSGSPTFAGVLNSFACFDISYFELSVESAIVGKDGGEFLFPNGIEKGTLFAGVVRGTKTELNAVGLTFAVNELERDETLTQISSSQIESNVLLRRGLIDVNGAALAAPVITATTARMDLDFIYGDFNNEIPFEGLVVADLSYDLGVTPATVFNVTQTTSVVVSSVTPVLNTPGQYDVVIAAGALSADVISVALFKAGFEMPAFTYVIP
jgi:hypothetical protein